MLQTAKQKDGPGPLTSTAKGMKQPTLEFSLWLKPPYWVYSQMRPSLAHLRTQFAEHILKTKAMYVAGTQQKFNKYLLDKCVNK